MEPGRCPGKFSVSGTNAKLKILIFTSFSKKVVTVPFLHCFIISLQLLNFKALKGFFTQKISNNKQKKILNLIFYSYKRFSVVAD